MSEMNVIPAEQGALATPSQDMERAIMAGFDSTDIELPVDTNENLTAEPAVDKNEESVVDKSPEEKVMASIPQDELNLLVERAKKIDALEERLERTHQKVTGKMGELIQKIEEVRSSSGRGFDQKASERVAAEFPELAHLLFGNDKQESAQESASQSNPNDAIVTAFEKIKSENEEYQKKMELRLLDRAHPDWRDNYSSPEFIKWADAALTEEQRHELNSSWDADLVINRISQFKDFKTKGQQVEEKRKAKNNAILDAAITPRGIPRGSAVKSSGNELMSSLLKAFDGS